MKKPDLKQIATLTAAGKLSVTVGSAQAQDCTSFLDLQLDDTPTFLVADEAPEGSEPSATDFTEVTLYTEGQEAGSTIAMSILGLPEVPNLDIALIYAGSVTEGDSSLGCFGSYLLEGGGTIISAFKTGISDINGLEGGNFINPETPLGTVPEGNGATVDEVDVLVNLNDALDAENFEPADDFYVQAIAIPSESNLDVLQGFVSNVVHVTFNRVDAPPSSGDGKGDDGGDGMDPDTPPSDDGKAT